MYWPAQETCSPFLPRMTPAVRIILVATIAAFLIQLVANLITPHIYAETFGLSLDGLRDGRIWQPITYLFVHDGVLHIIFNLIGVFFFAPDVERAMGSLRFTLLYLACGIVGGLGWLFLSHPGEVCVGASGAVFGVLGAFAALFPSRQVTLLLFLIFPVTVTAWGLAVILGLVSFALLLSSAGGVAHAAHLGGGLLGFLWGYRIARQDAAGLVYEPRRWLCWIPMPRRRRRLRIVRATDLEPPSEKEVDEILDKIGSHGFGSLSEDQRDVLDRASRSYRGR